MKRVAVLERHLLLEGVCGSEVDAPLEQFAGSAPAGGQQVAVERDNLAQQPQAFAVNADVNARTERAWE